MRGSNSSMEDVIPPTKALVNEASWLGAPEWAQILYEEIFEIESQVKSVIDMKEEISEWKQINSKRN